jgi:hypothetical protein
MNNLSLSNHFALWLCLNLYPCKALVPLSPLVPLVHHVIDYVRPLWGCCAHRLQVVCLQAYEYGTVLVTGGWGCHCHLTLICGLLCVTICWVVILWPGSWWRGKSNLDRDSNHLACCWLSFLETLKYSRFLWPVQISMGCHAPSR